MNEWNASIEITDEMAFEFLSHEKNVAALHADLDTAEACYVCGSEAGEHHECECAMCGKPVCDDCVTADNEQRCINCAEESE